MREAIFFIRGTKAIENDGIWQFSTTKNWKIVEDAIYSFVKDIFSGRDLYDVSKTLIGLIPNFDKSEFVNQSYPICHA